MSFRCHLQSSSVLSVVYTESKKQVPKWNIFHEDLKTQYLSPVPKSTGPRTHCINLLSDSNPLASAYWVLAYRSEPPQLAFLIPGGSLAPLFHVSNVSSISDTYEEFWEKCRSWVRKFTVPFVPSILQSASYVDRLTLSQVVASASTWYCVTVNRTGYTVGIGFKECHIGNLNVLILTTFLCSAEKFP